MHDLVVLGSGAAGMTAALTASLNGLNPLVIERSALIGGTTAISAGSAWVPNAMPPPGTDDADAARRYLDAAVASDRDAPRRAAFLARGPAMIRLLAAHTPVRFAPYPHHPDYLQHLDGATLAGRSLEPLTFDGRLLGAALASLRPPPPEFTLLGGMMVNRDDIRHLMASPRSPAAIGHVAALLARHLADRARWPRGTLLVMGNALAGRLLHALRQRGVEIRTGTAVRTLELAGDGGATLGVTDRDGRDATLQARLGVVLATGGFSHHPALRQQLFPAPVADYSVVPDDNTGGGIALGLAAGGRLGDGGADAAFWAPVSVRRRADASLAVFPHFVLDRGKPGLVAVDQAGRRFVNEATSYQRFVQAMYRSHARAPAIPCHFVCDARFLRRYGLGMVRPRTRRISPFLADGYLTQAPTLRALAGTLGIDADGLADTVARNNRYAAEGRDPDFGKGDEPYGRNLGDPAHLPNPCLGSIEMPPFYAVRIHPGDIGTGIGLITDAHARLLRSDDTPIPGLYACGNDMQSIMAGTYPGPGATIGPAMTFGYIAASHAAGAPTPDDDQR